MTITVGGILISRMEISAGLQGVNAQIADTALDHTHKTVGRASMQGVKTNIKTRTP